jgi:hypothetical protein
MTRAAPRDAVTRTLADQTRRAVFERIRRSAVCAPVALMRKIVFAEPAGQDAGGTV